MLALKKRSKCETAEWKSLRVSQKKLKSQRERWRVAGCWGACCERNKRCLTSAQVHPDDTQVFQLVMSNLWRLTRP